jgi:predicted choloylglycine hydrolase
MRYFSIFTLLLCITAFSSIPASACTTIIVSGKATKDGRPLMWKNSDTDSPHHSVFYADHRGYPFLGIIRRSTKSEATGSIWAGTNSKGFSIMNTMSYNLTDSAVYSRNGAVMRRALEVCATVDEFQHYLDTLPRPMKVETNYGVMDAAGGAAYFETNSNGYRKLDVNDPTVAPNGYLVYTNFSYTGFYDKGQGYIRYLSVQHQVARVVQSKEFTPRWILNNLSRSYYHSQLDLDFTSPEALQLFKSGYIPDQDLIPRFSTASATIIQGVRKDENPELTTMWAALGYPPCAVAMPAWVKAGRNNTPLIMRDPETRTSRMTQWTDSVQTTLYDIERGHGQAYLHFSKVYNSEGTGYMQVLSPIEDYVFAETESYLAKWRAAGKLNLAEVKQLGEDNSSYVEEHLPPIR